jgi:hypothetical protein
VHLVIPAGGNREGYIYYEVTEHHGTEAARARVAIRAWDWSAWTMGLGPEEGSVRLVWQVVGGGGRVGCAAFVIYRAGQPARLARWWTPRWAAASRGRARLAAKNRPRRRPLLSFSSRARQLGP